MKRILLVCTTLLFVTAALATSSARAHEIRPAIATARFDNAGRYEVEIGFNLEAVLAGVSPVHADTNESPNARAYDSLRRLPPDGLRVRFQEFAPDYLAGIVIEFDDRRVTPAVLAVEVPAVGDTRVARLSRVRLGGAVPPGAREFRWAYAAQFGNSILRLPGAAPGEVAALWLTDGARSDRYVLGVGVQPMTRLEVFRQYTVLGFTHILPRGLDHILFVLGLFLLANRFKPLLWQVTAFTVAHSITLGLTIYGVFSLSSAIVEPLIAASIVYVAVENMLTSRLHLWRVFIVFGFGLLHGMGFAGVLQEVGLPRAQFLAGLISFNLGVELGQLTVILLAFVAVGAWFRDRAWYRQRIVLPASALIALVGLYWTVERIAG
ncbi:MAG: HupE/UreJ family protein [Desulfobacterales bacterium]|nr:HupE/UreJ family protein [Desulfobacterales bacterium]